LEGVLQVVCDSSTDIIICGDIKVDYRVENERKRQLNNLLHSFDLNSIITFPTRIHNNSVTTIDNIFIDTSRFKDYTAIPILNGLATPIMFADDTSIMMKSNNISQLQSELNIVMS
jgi:hypothetical protein